MPAIGIGIVIWSGSCLDCIASGACNQSLTKLLISYLTPCIFNSCLLKDFVVVCSKFFVVVCSNFVSSLFVFGCNIARDGPWSGRGRTQVIMMLPPSLMVILGLIGYSHTTFRTQKVKFR